LAKTKSRTKTTKKPNRRIGGFISFSSKLSLKQKLRGNRLIAVLILALLLVGSGIFLASRSHAASIDPTTWAPTTPGAYFFDRSNLTGNAESDFSSRESQFGRKFDGEMYYVPADVTSADLADAHWSLASDKVPFVTLSWADGNNPTNIIPQIASGAYDKQITDFALSVKSQLSPYGRTLVRPFWEFNYEGSEWNDVNYGNNAADFVAAWQHFVNIFRQNNVTNVKWLWNPIRIGSSQAQNPTPYYPGSSYVDWIGTDAYPKNSYLTLYQLATTSGSGISFDWYDTFKSYGKPMMFGETGVLPENKYSSGAQTRATWWNDALTELINQMPDVRAVEYFDSNTTADDWEYDAPGTTTGDSGSEAISAAATAADNCYLNLFSSICGGKPPTPPPSPSPSLSGSPSRTPSPHPTPTPSGTATPHPTPTPSGTPKPSTSPTKTPSVGSVTLSTSADTYVFSGAPYQTNGSAANLHVAAYNLRALLKFATDDAVPDGDKATSVQLKLYTVQNPAGKGGYEVHPESTAWQQSSADWNNQPTWNTNVLETSSTPDVRSWITINLPVSSLNNGGPTAYGIRYTAATNTVEEFDSSASAQYGPKLVINYSPSGTGMSAGSLFYLGTGSLAAILLVLVIF
jgi:hypothetical protein